MGRELKRVPMDFNWELNKIWKGFINPFEYKRCKKCDGLGYSKEYEELKDIWYGWHNPSYKPNPYNSNARYNANAWNHNLEQEDVNALVEAGRLFDFTRVPLNDEQREIIKNSKSCWLPFDNGYIPTAKEVNEWSLKGFGHDSLNCWIVIKAKLKREGKTHKCGHCNGSGEDWRHDNGKWIQFKLKRQYENWKQYEPPHGEGFQLWENTSEGSPMTPVFKTILELCEFCENGKISVFGGETATKERWLQMLDENFVRHEEGNMIFV